VKPHLKPWRTDIDGKLAGDFAAELKRLGQTQRAGTERLMRTFLGLDPDVRAMMLQILTPDRTALLAKLILKELAAKGSTACVGGAGARGSCNGVHRMSSPDGRLEMPGLRRRRPLGDAAWLGDRAGAVVGAGGRRPCCRLPGSARQHMGLAAVVITGPVAV
jgi:hypothetical protein